MTHTHDPLRALSDRMADAVAHARPALVMVNGRRRQPATGVVVAANMILTADHVLERDDDLTIGTDDDATHAVRLIGRDPYTDLALLEVPGANLTPLAVASGTARVGQLVLAVGRPTTGGPMASLGIVSAVGGPLRTQRGGVIEQIIQTDATPYPGFSGGPLLDADGAMLGLLTTGLAGGAPLAIPAAIALATVASLTQHGHVRRGYLGIAGQPVELPEGQRRGQYMGGLLLVRVEADSPALHGGLLVGDILVAVDGQPVRDPDDLQPMLSGARVGTSVPVEVIRGGEIKQLAVTIAQRKA